MKKRDLKTMGQLWFNTSCYTHEMYYVCFKEEMQKKVNKTELQVFAR